MKRPLKVASAGLVLAALAGAGVVAGGGSGATPEAGAARLPATAEVTRRDLVEHEEVDGTLGYGTPADLRLATPGTITALPAEGAVVDRGGVIAEVDGAAVRLLFGQRPMWRQLDPGVGDGPDVRQLEENLVALGHASRANLAVDDDWTDATTAAVKRWQKAIGAEQTGVVTPGAVAVVTGPVRIAEHKATVGSPAAAGPVVSVTGTEKVVVVDLQASRRALLAVGRPVRLELPDGSTVNGAVRAVATVVTPAKDADSEPTLEVTIALPADAGADAAFELAPVEVQVDAVQAEGALTVPVDALLALAEGGYAVEVVDGEATALRPVELGASAGGFVQITGDLDEGDRVVVPR